jgi:hypothetical protein
MNQAAPNTSVFLCPYHWISAAFPSGSSCCCYQKDNYLCCFIWGSKTNCNTEVVQRTAAFSTVLVKKIMWYLAFRVVNKYNIVQVRITCGLDCNVSDEYTACVFSRVSEKGCSRFIQKSIHTRCFSVRAEEHNVFRFEMVSWNGGEMGFVME